MINLLMIEMDDWEGLYYEGILVDEGHRLETEWVMALVQEFDRVSKLGVEYRSIFYDGESDSPLFAYGDDEGRFNRLPPILDETTFNALYFAAVNDYYCDMAKRTVQEALREKPI